MKQLYLIRHAKSSWKKQALADFDRPLNKRGKHDVPLMGDWMKKKKIRLDLIRTSPARRALTTARTIAEKIDYPKKAMVEDIQLYLADVPELLEVVRSLEQSIEKAALVGHNPGMTDFVNYLTDDDIENIPTCGVICIDFLVDEWQYIDKGLGTLVFFEYPKKHY